MTSRPKFQARRYLKILSLLNVLYPIPVEIDDIARGNNLPQHKVMAYLTNLLEAGLIKLRKERTESTNMLYQTLEERHTIDG